VLTTLVCSYRGIELAKMIHVEIREGRLEVAKSGSAPGIEPGTTSTLKTYHTPRPSGRATRLTVLLHI
jgi:hypothetical protein